MKKVLAAVLAALVVLGAGLYFFVARPLLRPSEVTAVAERALATDDLLLLAGINVKQAVFLEKWLLGSPRVTPVAATPPPAVADRSLLDHLRAAGVDPRHDVDHALYALYPADAAGSRHAVILVGRFNPAAVNAYLTRELAATPRPGPGPASFDVTRIDPATCQPGASWVVTVARGVDRAGRPDLPADPRRPPDRRARRHAGAARLVARSRARGRGERGHPGSRAARESAPPSPS